MRFLGLFFALAGCAATVNSNVNNQDQDLSVPPGSDLSVNENDLSGAAPDLTPPGPSAMIQAVRDTADSANTPDGGMLAMALPVHDVLVTYLRPEVSGETDDPPGFFVQADHDGPALFVRVDPASLTPAPQVGDLVEFTVTGAGKDAGGVRQATSITDWMLVSGGHQLVTLTQDLSSATDLVTALDSYESELSKITGTVAGNFGGSGAGYVQANLTTAGVATGVRLRLPATLRDALDVVQGCQVTVATPLWRFKTTAQPSAWVSGDLILDNCPPPRVVSALATDATHVVVSFDHFIGASSLVASGGQFTFDNGLLVDNSSGTAATLTAPNQVTVITTTQTSGTLYTVTVGTSIDDLRTGLDPAHTTATFHGFTGPATLRITEFTPGISSNFDLLELRAVAGGSVNGFTFQQDLTVAPKLLATLPDAVVQTDDIIVLHIKPTPSPLPSPIPELATQTDCTSPSCYATAWDFNGTSDIGNSARVLVIKDGKGNLQDGVAFFNRTADADAAFLAQVTALRDAGQWTCAAAACVAADATRSNLCGNSAGAASLKRTGAGDTNSVADWPATGLTGSSYGHVP